MMYRRFGAVWQPLEMPSQSTRMIDKLPGHSKLPGQFLGQSLHAKGFRGVMSAVKHVESQFFGQGKSPMRPFSGNKRIDPFNSCLFYFAAGAPGDNTDSSTNRGTTAQQSG